MTEKYKVLGQYIKDASSETPDIETYLFVREIISKYKLGIDITSKALKNKMIEVTTKFVFQDKEDNKKKAYFEMNYSTIIKLIDKISSKKELEKIIICDLQNEIYPNLERAFLNLLHDSGYESVKFSKKVDFEELYKQRFS
ncbi:protein-export chaperone SecB [Candidatus Pelagibacter sp.]|uniref:protein-export chaperone SecB n=1 Tax=Candidatus Pelagibacter sp. TaxID=2024849 RepID=UPI003F86CCBC